MGYLIYYLETTKYFTLFAVLIITYVYFNYTNFNSSKGAIFQRRSLIVFFIFTLFFFVIIFYGTIQPREWDFTCFYLIGKVAASGLDIYNPDHYFLVLRHADIPFELSADFKSEFMVTGCLYPPPTVFLFLPLGFMTYTHGMYFFYALILLAIISCIYQIKETFYKNEGWESWLIVSIIVLLTAPLYSVVYYAQTLIFLLLLFILIYKNRERKIAGLYLAISIFIKPFAVVFLVYFLLRKRWDVILSFILSAMAIVLVTIVFFGIQPFETYVFNNPSQRIPNYILFEDVNQSLLAVLTRVMEDFQKAQMVYYIISFAIVIFSGFLIFVQIKRKGSYDIFFPLLLSICLIIYPNALYHYAVVQLLSAMILLNYIRNTNLKYFFLFFFFLAFYGRIFYVNIYVLVVSVLLIFEGEVERSFKGRRIAEAK